MRGGDWVTFDKKMLTDLSKNLYSSFSFCGDVMVDSGVILTILDFCLE